MEIEYKEKIRPLLDTYDKITELLRNEPISLPKIVVVGDQSSGKSSVLESVTGIDTPRGQNTVTRGPIIIQIRCAGPADDERAFIWCEGNQTEKLQIQLDQIGQAILDKQTELITAEKVEITATPVHVEVHKHDAPDLTLYDLPGLTYKNEKMIAMIRKIVEKYTAGDETLILLITPANTDLTTSEALSLCRNNNNFEERTIAVVTKIDLGVAERGIYAKIMNNELGLKYPPIVVRNRTQDEILNCVSWKVIRERELGLFNEHPELKKLPDSCKGTKNLIDRLVYLQRQKILNSKYDVMEKINQQLNQKKIELNKLPPSISTPYEKSVRFDTCLNKFIKAFKSSIKGEENNTTSINMSTIVRGKIENDVKLFQKNRKNFFHPSFAALIEDKIIQSRDFSLSNFINSKVFLKIIKAEITSATSASENLLNDVISYVKENLLSLSEEPFNEHPLLKRAIQMEIKALVETQRQTIQAFMTHLLYMETQFTFTTNAYYMNVYTKINRYISDKKSQHKKFAKSLFYSENDHNPFIQTEPNVSITPGYVEVNDIAISEGDLYNPKILNAHSDLELAVVNIQASCFAFWQVFEKRFLDYYHMEIIFQTLLFFKHQLGDILWKKFSPHLNDNVRDMIIETQTITSKRLNLQKSISDLEKARNELESKL